MIYNQCQGLKRKGNQFANGVVWISFFFSLIISVNRAATPLCFQLLICMSCNFIFKNKPEKGLSDHTHQFFCSNIEKLTIMSFEQRSHFMQQKRYDVKSAEFVAIPSYGIKWDTDPCMTSVICNKLLAWGKRRTIAKQEENANQLQQENYVLSSKMSSTP